MDRIEPLIQAIAMSIRSGSNDGKDPDPGARPPFDITSTRVLDLSSTDLPEGVAKVDRTVVQVVPAYETLGAHGEKASAADKRPISVEELVIVWCLCGNNVDGGDGAGSTLRIQTRAGASADIVQKSGRLVIFAAGLSHEAVVGGARQMQPWLVNRMSVFGASDESS